MPNKRQRVNAAPKVFMFAPIFVQHHVRFKKTLNIERSINFPLRKHHKGRQEDIEEIREAVKKEARKRVS